MSAYVVDPQLINAIISALENAVAQEGKYPSRFPDLRYLKTSTIRDMVTGDPADFGRTLYAMNINAVEQRYPDSDLPGTYDGDKLAAFQFKRISWDMLNKFQVYKNLSCYLYQCSEGDVDKLPLFQAMEELKSAMAEHFVESLPEYENAKWG